MRTSASLVVLGLVLGLVGPTAASSQAVYTSDTSIQSVRFEIADGVRVDQKALVRSIGTRAPGQIQELRRALTWVPFVSDVPEQRFDPFELQRDRERLRRHMARTGYPDASVQYEVTRHDANSVDIVFLIEPGTPVRVGALRVEWSDATRRPDLSQADVLDAVRSRVTLTTGDLLDARRLEPSRTAVRRWLADQGHPFAEVAVRTAEPDDAGRAELIVEITSGARARIGSIVVEGRGRLSEATIATATRVEEGDWYALSTLRGASERLASLSLVRTADFQASPDPRSDSLVVLRLHLTEVEPRSIEAQAGYASDGGIASDASWSHRNLLGGGRSLVTSIGGQSGLLALDPTPKRFVRASVTVQQPLLWGTLWSLSVGPVAEFRDDYRDRSLETGLDFRLFRRFGELSIVAASYEISTRRVYDFRFGEISNGINLFDLLESGQITSAENLDRQLGRSVLTFSGSIAQLDAPTDPTRGFAIEPLVAFSLPVGVEDTEFAKASLRASAYLPLGPLGLAARIGGGRVVPRGKSIPTSSGDRLTSYVQLRDELFRLGGAQNVRGWAEEQLGPKVPTPVLTLVDTTVVVGADGFTPLGGFERIDGSLEVRFPLAGEAWGGHTFLDAGRLWTTDRRFQDVPDRFGGERLFWATGVGIDWSTLVGSIRLSVGYKLNPTLLDLVSADEALGLLLGTLTEDQLNPRRLRRFRVHVGIGSRL